MSVHLCVKAFTTSLGAHYCNTDRASFEVSPGTPTHCQPPTTTTTTGYCSVAEQGYGCMETCRGRPGTKMRRRIFFLKRRRQEEESDTISLSTERGIVLDLACLIYKHHITITLLSFLPRGTVFLRRS